MKSNSITDAAVGVLAVKTSVEGAYLNVRINCKSFDDEKFVSDMLLKSGEILEKLMIFLEFIEKSYLTL
ncbi:MAG: cyclodeaminase/cyclohydrolase family protein [Saprospiraceae bacterium]